MRRGPGLSQIPNDLPPGGPLPLSCSFGSEARGGHGNVGPASRVPMTTGSPSGGAGAHQSVQVAHFGRGARREVGVRGGACRGVASPLPISSSRGCTVEMSPGPHHSHILMNTSSFAGCLLFSGSLCPPLLLLLLEVTFQIH